MKKLVLVVAVSLVSSQLQAQEVLGNLSSNPFDPNSTANPFGAGSPYKSDGVNNRFGRADDGKFIRNSSAKRS